jgi:hypothetical protein
MLVAQVSRVGNSALIKREAITLPLDHAFGVELADVGSAAIEVHCQCRRADGRVLSGSRPRSDWRAIIGDGLSHRGPSICAAQQGTSFSLAAGRRIMPWICRRWSNSVADDPMGTL